MRERIKIPLPIPLISTRGQHTRFLLRGYKYIISLNYDNVNIYIECLQTSKNVTFRRKLYVLYEMW